MGGTEIDLQNKIQAQPYSATPVDKTKLKQGHIHPKTLQGETSTQI